MKHNLIFEENAPEYVKERNKQLLEAYESINITIEKIQGWLDDEHLRTRIQSDMTKRNDVKSSIYQSTTPWCVVSIGCDIEGRYNIVYSLDHRIQEMIGTTFASAFIRRINEFTPGAMEPFVNIGCLYQDCVSVFNNLLEETKYETFHEIITKTKHDI
jgi:hypothetical protein